MTANKDFNQIFEELHYLQNCKLSLAIFFDLFARKIEIDKDIWREASVEEVCQARWIGRLTSLLAFDNSAIYRERIKISGMKLFNDDLNYYTEMANHGQLSVREMLVMALKYEQLDIIRNPFSAIVLDSPEFDQINTRLAAEAENHALAIQNHIRLRLSEL
ncbi:MAG: hypothetical protein GX409_09550 [candidate division Zixibacteria bacterium]|nr:hypothetical protein [candidate division Zixibacteria bacterium]